MEDKNILASDCIVLCCCCQCLILQMVVFILLRIPYKMVHKTRSFIKRKLGRRRREKAVTKGEIRRDREGSGAISGGSMSFRVVSDCGCCMEEVEKVLEGLSENGEFAFGSFWGGREEENSGLGRLDTTNVVVEEFDYNVVHCNFIEMVGSITYK